MRFFSIQEVLELAFSILYDPDETLNFIAPNKYEVSSAVINYRITELKGTPKDHPSNSFLLYCLLLVLLAPSRSSCHSPWSLGLTLATSGSLTYVGNLCALVGRFVLGFAVVCPAGSPVTYFGAV